MTRPATTKPTTARPATTRPATARPPRKTAAPRPAADPVTIELVRQGIMAVTADMRTALMRAAPSPLIYAAQEFATGLFTPAGDTVSAAVGAPLLIRGMAHAVGAAIRGLRPEAMGPGDIYITNDPGITGTGLQHVAVMAPVFLKDTVAGWCACVARWPDVGGADAGITTDVFAEGLQLPLLKYRDRGRVNDDLAAIIALNVRSPGDGLAVLAAQVAAVTEGGQRFLEVVARHGRDGAQAAIAAIMDHAETRARAAVAAIPDGVYEAESFMDDDGVTLGLPVAVRVRAVVAGDQLTIDLSGLSAKVRGFYNGGAAAGAACAELAFRCLITPHDTLLDDGALRGLHTVLPPGRVISAGRPAAMRSWQTVALTVVDTVFRALAPALPQRAVAGHHADAVTATFHVNGRTAESRSAESRTPDSRTADSRIPESKTPESKTPESRIPESRIPESKTAAAVAGSLGALGGGFGATRSGDGVSAAAIGHDAGVATEEIEARYPLVVESHALVPDSGGAGRHRGGLGVERVVRALTDITLTTRAERAHCRPWGIAGGRDARPNAVALRINGHWKTEFTNAKLTAVAIRAGDAFRLRSGGGGGYGPPLERPVTDVVTDVRQGYVSAHEAGVFYGVVIDPHTARVNEPATALIRGTGLPLLAPPERER